MKNTRKPALFAVSAIMVAIVAFIAVGLNAFAADKTAESKTAKEYKWPDTNGAQPGIWTQDYDAALALAKNKNFPILINFTGSDWCPWCKLMEKMVFSTHQWKDYAKDTLVMAFIDFPRNPDLVPAKYTARNKTLAKTYGISGYPTYILVRSDGQTEIGRLGASNQASPEWFIDEVKKLLEKDRKLINMTPEKKAKYDALIAKHKAAVKKLTDWIENEKPEENEENDQKFRAFREAIREAENEINNMVDNL